MPTHPDNNKENGLYRQAALDAQFMHQHGATMLLPKFNHVILAIALAALVACSIVYISTQKLAQTAQVSGFLQSTGSEVAIKTKETAGVMANVYVSNGQWVEAGTQLVKIKRTRHSLLGQAGIEHETKQLRAEHQSHMLILQAKLDAAQLADAHLQVSLQSVSTQLGLLNEQIIHIQQQRDIAYKTWQDTLALTQQALLANADAQQSQLQVLRISQQLAAVKLQYNQLQAQHEEYKQQASQQSHTRIQLEQERKLDQLSFEEQLESLEQSLFYTLYAPINGVVENLFTDVGDSLGFQQNLLQLLPKKQAFVAILHVPAEQFGFIEKGQRVYLKVDGFSYQKYGTLLGEVDHIASQIMLAGDMQKQAATRSQAAYVVTVRLSSAHMLAQARKWPLTSGMSIQASITLDEPSILEWLLAPLYELRGRAV